MKHTWAWGCMACLSAALTCGGTAWAQTQATQRAGKNEAQALKWFNLLDADHDGRVSWDEAQVGIRFRPSLADEFKRADLNGDGFLTQPEIRAVAAQRRAEREARRLREAAAHDAPAQPQPQPTPPIQAEPPAR